MIEYFFAGIVLIYSLGIIIMILSYLRIDQIECAGDLTDHKVSILVPVRNEQQTVFKTIESILKNDISKIKYEIIVIDDHSTDKTLEGLYVEYEDFNQIRIIQLPPDQFGKKSAIKYGVSHAEGDLIITTDADCVVPATWIRSYLSAYTKDESIKMVFGPVSYPIRGTFGSLLNTELMGLVGLGAATLNIGKPTMCNGANMSYRKSVFEELNGYEGNLHIPSGDDEFLLRKVFHKYPEGVKYIKSHVCLVGSNAPDSLREFYYQRVRWASKWKHHNDFTSKIAPLLVFLFNMVMILLFAKLINEVSILLIILILIKVLVDYLFIYVVTSSLRQKLNKIAFILLQIIYPFYVVFFGIASNFGGYHWKGRTVR